MRLLLIAEYEVDEGDEEGLRLTMMEFGAAIEPLHPKRYHAAIRESADKIMEVFD